MANGPDGVARIYADSQSNPHQIYYDGSQSFCGESASSQGSGWYRFSSFSSLRAGLGDCGCQGNADHGQALAQGYMCSTRDYRNFELTVYVRNWNGSDGLTWYGRGGRHTDSCPCCGFSYKMSLEPNRVRFRKETWHVHYDDVSGQSWSKPSGTFGTKYVCMDDGQKVTGELYLDRSNNNNWQLEFSSVDSGSCCSGGGKCGTSDGQPGLWGGPYVVLRSDGDTFDFSKLSVREIQPFTKDGSTSPGSGTGGTPSQQPLGAWQWDGTQWIWVPNTNPAPGGSVPPGSTSGGNPGSGSPSTGGTGAVVIIGGNEPQTQVPAQPPPPIIRISKKFTYIYHLNADDQTCNISGPLEDRPTTELFNTLGDSPPSYRNLDNTYSRTGLRVMTKDSIIFGEVIKKLKITMKKNNSPTGNINVRLRDSNDTIVQTFDYIGGGTLNASALDFNDVGYDFIYKKADRPTKVGDRYTVEFTGGDATNYIQVMVVDVDKTDGYNSCLTAYTTSWVDDPGKDVVTTFYIPE